MSASGSVPDADVDVNASSHLLPKQAPTPEEDSELPADQIDQQKKGFLAYFQTKEFYITLVLGWVLDWDSVYSVSDLIRSKANPRHCQYLDRYFHHASRPTEMGDPRVPDLAELCFIEPHFHALYDIPLRH